MNNNNDCLFCTLLWLCVSFFEVRKKKVGVQSCIPYAQAPKDHGARVSRCIEEMEDIEQFFIMIRIVEGLLIRAKRIAGHSDQKIR